MRVLTALGAASLSLMSPLSAQNVAIHGDNGVTLGPPPAVAVKPVTDTVGVRQITDDYRWLEDKNAPDTRAYINAEMAYTGTYFDQLKPLKERIAARLTELERVDVVGMPQQRANRLYYSKRLAAENQASIYMRALDRPESSEVRLIDAGKLSTDGNASVGIASISEDGRLLVYGVRHGGADEESIRVLDVDAGQDLSDTLPLARYSGFALTLDKKVLYYAKTLKSGGGAVFQHSMGTSADADTQIFGDSYMGNAIGPLDLVGVRMSQNGHWLVVSVSHGVPATREDILVRDLRQAGSAFQPLVMGVDSRFELHFAGDDMFVSTDYGAPNGRVLRATLGDPTTKNWPVVVPEGKDVIDRVSIVDRRMFVGRLVDVKSDTTIYTLDGKQVGKIQYPTIGNGSVVTGREDSPVGFYTFSSFTVPPTIFEYNVGNGKSTVWSKSKAPFDVDKYEVRQVFYTSKDGTRIPMFVAGRKGLTMDGKAPLMMTGYGGFNLSEEPGFNSMYAWWMEQGGFFALPNLRGGGEYGESWHKAGMFEKKQNVFDDWYAAAEYLLANHYTTRERLGIWGRSNGGLLMGASMTQRPDLYGAILCGYPLLDMSRFQNFLVGRWWTTEYGSAANPEQAAYILKYSPYQNIRPGVKYPAIMFLTGDSDTRVDPLHARKMAAKMQATVMAEPADERRPVLLHYDVRAGHSAGVSVTQLVNDTADELTFLWNETGGK